MCVRACVCVCDHVCVCVCLCVSKRRHASSLFIHHARGTPSTVQFLSAELMVKFSFKKLGVTVTIGAALAEVEVIKEKKGLSLLRI